MRWGVTLSGLFLCAWAIAQPPAGTPGTTLLPTPFRAFIAYGGDRVGKFHCPVCERELQPTVGVFVRFNPEKEKPPVEGRNLNGVNQLLQKLNGLALDKVGDRFGAFAAYLWLDKDYLDDDARQTYTDTLKGIGSQNKLDQVELGLVKGRSPVNDGYGLKETADLTVLVYDRLKVRQRYEFEKIEQFQPKDIAAIVAEATAMLPSSKDKKKRP